MSRIISPRRRVETMSRVRDFRWLDSPTAGCSFPCDDAGTPLAPTNDAAAENILGCFTDFAVEDRGLIEWPHIYVEAAVLKCDCGDEITLDGFTNTCGRCQADYNMPGQLLAPRSQWGEDTGESLADILRIP